MTEKTYKRETALALIVFLCVLFIAGIWEPRAAEAAQYLTAPVFLFMGAAFGLDAYSKQIK